MTQLIRRLPHHGYMGYIRTPGRQQAAPRDRARRPA
jgi:hypothetical protein